MCWINIPLSALWEWKDQEMQLAQYAKAKLFKRDAPKRKKWTRSVYLGSEISSLDNMYTWRAYGADETRLKYTIVHGLAPHERLYAKLLKMWTLFMIKIWKVPQQRFIFQHKKTEFLKKVPI